MSAAPVFHLQGVVAERRSGRAVFEVEIGAMAPPWPVAGGWTG